MRQTAAGDSAVGAPCRWLFVCVTVLLVGTGLTLGSELPEGFRLEPVVSGFDQPTALAATGDGLVLIAEKAGTIRSLRHGRLDAQPFCTLSVDAQGDGGLLGMAIDPRVGSSNVLYLYYTAPDGRNQIGRIAFGTSGCVGSLDVVFADLGSSSSGLRVGGGIAFGPDEMLYVATGDMEESSSARDDGSVQGKILRMTPDGMIPADNPEADSYVYAKGVRFSRGVVVSVDGDVYASDRGETFDDSKDELNFVPSGGDLGWDAASGDSGGTYDDPLVWWEPPFGAAGLSIYAEVAFPDLADDGLDSDEDRYGPDLFPGSRNVDDNGQGECVGSNNNGQPCSSDADCPDERQSFFTGLFTEEAYCAFPDDAAEYCPSGTPAGDDACGNSGAAGIDEPDESFLNNLFLAVDGSDAIVRAVLNPEDATELASWSTFMDSSFLNDCPTGWSDVMAGADGFLYAIAGNGGAAGDGALYRIIHDEAPGPREVAKQGSYFPLMVDKADPNADELELTWEDLRSDAFQPRDEAGDPVFPEREYRVWRGDLGSFYSHTVLSELDGIPGSEVNGALRSATVASTEGSTYFLVSARGANLEGGLGTATDGTTRPGAAVTDLCEDIGFHGPPDFLEWTCGQDFTLVDELGETHSLYDLRGHVIMIDFSAIWCGPCQSEADVLENLHDDYKDRGVKVLTVLNDEPNSLDDWVGRPTPAECRDWSDRPEGNPDHTFTCFVDSLTSEGERKAWPNYNKHGGVPTNVILDRGLRVVYTTAGYPEGEIRDQLDLLVGTTDSCLQ